MASKNYYSFSSSTRRRAGTHGMDSIFGWTIFLFLLIGFALFCWMGSFYIFGHPEKAGNYRLLRRLHKLDDLQRFEITEAPRGEFLKPKQLLERFGNLSPHDIRRLNESLLRNFLRNYHQTHDLIPYATGTYKVLATFPLTEKKLFQPGICALVQAVEQPEILLEQVFPIASDDKLLTKIMKAKESSSEGLQVSSISTTASKKAMKEFASEVAFSKKSNLTTLEQALPTGQEIKLEKPFDLSAIIHVERLPDGRIKLTTMPLLYGTYGTKEGGTRFSLEPPDNLNIETGLPLLSLSEMTNAEEQYNAYRTKMGFPKKNLSSTPLSALSPSIQILPRDTFSASTQTVRTSTTTSSPVVKTPLPPLENNSPEPAVARALPVNIPAILPAIPTKTGSSDPLSAIVSSTPTLPLGTPDLSRVSPAANKMTAPIPPLAGALPPALTTLPKDSNAASLISTNTLLEASPTLVTDSSWPLYEPGKMPRGRLIAPTEFRTLAEQGLAGERLYLQGNFAVTASGQDRSVLRYQLNASALPLDRIGKTRIIVSYPTGYQPPAEGISLTRNQDHPFMITDVKKGSDGTFNVYVREITK